MKSFSDKQLRDATQIAYIDLDEAKRAAGAAGSTDFTISGLEKYYNALHPGKSLRDELKEREVAFSSVANWEVLVVGDDNANSGFYACVLKPPGSDAIVAFRGSESQNATQVWKDWVQADLGLLNSIQTTQHLAAERFLNTNKGLLDKYNLYYTGHSLGGNLAEHAAVVSGRFGLSDNLAGCVSFDGPGFSDEYIIAHAAEISAISNKINHYAWSLVGCILFPLPGTNYIYISTNGGEPDLLNKHNTNYVPFDENGSVIRTNDLDPAMKAAIVATRTIDSPVLSIASLIINAIPKGRNSNGIRDFRQETQDHMMQLVDNADKKWCKATDWVGDKLLGAADSIGVLDWFADADGYQTRVFDKNNTTRKQLQSIYNAVYQKDSDYCTKFKNHVEHLQLLNSDLGAIAERIDPNKVSNTTSGGAPSSIKYVSQIPGDAGYNPADWGPYDSSAGCAVSCVSMALSSIGRDVTPKQICDNNGGSVYMYWGNSGIFSQTGGMTSLDDCLQKYSSDPANYAPPIIKLPDRQHYVLITGKNEDGSYTIMDPANSANTVWSGSNTPQIIQYRSSQ